jgi:hypothetical protein
LRHVGTRQNFDPVLPVRILLVILSQPLPNLSYSTPHDVVSRSVIVGSSMEDLNADCPFLELVAASRQGLIDDVLQYCGIALAVVEYRAFENLPQLIPHLFPLEVCAGMEEPI